MTELEYLQTKLKENEIAFDKLHSEYIELLKQQGELEKENEQLMKEKEYWKGQCISQSNLNSIYHNELSIAQEQGYAPTDTFKFCFGDLNKHLEKYKKFYNSNSKISERYINAAEDDSTEIYQDTETMEILSDYVILERLNEQDKTIKELEKENRGLQFKIIDMLDFVKEKGTVTREEIKKWWNGDVE